MSPKKTSRFRVLRAIGIAGPLLVIVWQLAGMVVHLIKIFG